MSNTDEIEVTVRNTGAKFRVTDPNGGESIAGATTVTWDVAGTTAAPISAPTVSIRLSTDGGLTFPTELADQRAQRRLAPVTMPNAATRAGPDHGPLGDLRGGSGFFDISDATSRTTARPTAPSAPINPQGTPGTRR